MIQGTCIAFSGFFLREPSWTKIREMFQNFRCIDFMRDEPSLTLENYCLKAVEEIRNTPGPHFLIGHSFGGYLALATAGLFPKPVEGIYLLSGLGYEKGVSASEYYSSTAQSLLSQFCKLDFGNQQITLTDPKAYLEAAVLPDSLPEGSITVNEPVSLILDIPRWQMHVPINGIKYIIPIEDKLTPVLLQEKIAKLLNAELYFISGGHVSPLVDTGWLSEGCVL